jgi:hypothetical protein
LKGLGLNEHEMLCPNFDPMVYTILKPIVDETSGHETRKFPSGEQMSWGLMLELWNAEVGKKIKARRSCSTKLQ